MRQAYRIDRVIAITYPHQRKKEFRSCFNRYLAKSHLVKCKACSETYEYCNFRGSIFTKVLFQNSAIIGCDFWGVRFNGCCFKNTIISNSVFMSCNFVDCSFDNLIIDDSVIVNTMLDYQINISNNIVLTEYPKIELNNELSNTLEILKQKPLLRKNKLFHISDNKVNMLNIFLLLKIFSQDELSILLKKWINNQERIPATYKMLENQLKKI